MFSETFSGKKLELNRDAKALLRKILEELAKEAEIAETKEEIRRIYPTSDPQEILRRRRKIEKTLEKLEKCNVNALSKALKRLPKMSSELKWLEDRVLITDQEGDLSRICKIAGIEDPSIQEFPLILSTLPVEVEGRDVFLVEPSLKSIAPDKFLEKILENDAGEKYLELLERFPELFSYDGPELSSMIEKSKEIYEKVRNMKKLLENLDEVLERSLEDLNSRIRRRLEEIEIRLKGTDLVELYHGLLEGVHPISEGMKELQEIIEEEVEEENSKLSELFGINVNLFEKAYPVEISERSKERLRELLERELKCKIFELAKELENELYKTVVELEKVYNQALWVDFCLSLYKKLKNSGYVFPEEFKGGIGFLEGKSLFLENPQPISYFLGSLPPNVKIHAKETKVAILTGANSGGKSTLLETFATIQMMAQMGMPVPAKRAWYEVLESIKIFRAKKRIEGAGALESVLKFLVSLILDEKKKLILIDELIESVTEPGAAAKILGKILGMMLKGNSYCIVVSHLGEELIREVPEIRVDGIEASGLSEDLSLIVDRQPKFGKIGKSTPELIVERLYLTGKGREREIFAKILEAFKKEDRPI